MQALSLRLAAALVTVLLAGMVLHGSAAAAVGAEARVADLPAAVDGVGVHADAADPVAVTGRGWSPSWPWAAARAAVALGLVVTVCAVVAGRTFRPIVVWLLARPNRTLPTARHCSPLAARRAPPAPAGC